MITDTVDRILSRRAALELGSGGLAILLDSSHCISVAAEDSPALDRNKALVRRLFVGCVNTGDESLIPSLYAPALIGDNAAPAGLPLPLRDFRLVAPDTRASVDTLVAEGDLVAALVTWRAPHPPSGTHIAGLTMHLFRLDQDQITEQWAVGWDWMDDEWLHFPSPSANPLAAS